MIVESHDALETAALLRGYVGTGELGRFATMVEDGYNAWECICAFEEGMLALDFKHPDMDCLKGWSIVVGWADGVQSVPLYVGWGAVEAWLEYHEDCCSVEPEYGVICWPVGAFVERHKSIPLASSPLSEESGITLNRAFKERATLEGVL